MPILYQIFRGIDKAFVIPYNRDMTNQEEVFYTTPDMEESYIQPEVELTNIDLTEEIQGTVTGDINND